MLKFPTSSPTPSSKTPSPSPANNILSTANPGKFFGTPPSSPSSKNKNGSSISTSLDLKNGSAARNQISTEDWIQFARSCLQALISTIIIGLIGSNFFLLMNIDLDKFFPNDINNFPYANPEKEGGKETINFIYSGKNTLFLTVIWRGIVKFFKSLSPFNWGKDIIEARLRQSRGGSRTNEQKTYTRQNSKASKSNMSRQRGGGEDYSNPAPCIQMDWLIKNEVANESIDKWSQKPIPQFGPLNKAAEPESEYPKGIKFPYSWKAVNYFPGGAKSLPPGVEEEKAGGGGCKQAFKNWLALTTMYSWKVLRGCLKGILSAFKDSCPTGNDIGGDLGRTLIFLGGPLCLFGAFFFFQFIGFGVTLFSSFYSDWGLGILGIILGFILPSLQSLSLLWTFFIIPLIISLPQIRIIMGKHFMLLTIIFGLLVNQNAALYLGASFGAAEILALIVVSLTVVRLWGKSKS